MPSYPGFALLLWFLSTQLPLFLQLALLCHPMCFYTECAQPCCASGGRKGEGPWSQVAMRLSSILEPRGKITKFWLQCHLQMGAPPSPHRAVYKRSSTRHDSSSKEAPCEWWLLPSKELHSL